MAGPLCRVACRCIVPLVDSLTMAMAHSPYTVVPPTAVQEESNEEDFLEWLYLKSRDDLSHRLVGLYRGTGTVCAKVGA